MCRIGVLVSLRVLAGFDRVCVSWCEDISQGGGAQGRNTREMYLLRIAV